MLSILFTAIILFTGATQASQYRYFLDESTKLFLKLENGTELTMFHTNFEDWKPLGNIVVPVSAKLQVLENVPDENREPGIEINLKLELGELQITAKREGAEVYTISAKEIDPVVAEKKVKSDIERVNRFWAKFEGQWEAKNFSKKDKDKLVMYTRSVVKEGHNIPISLDYPQAKWYTNVHHFQRENIAVDLANVAYLNISKKNKSIIVNNHFEIPIQLVFEQDGKNTILGDLRVTQNPTDRNTIMAQIPQLNASTMVLSEFNPDEEHDNKFQFGKISGEENQIEDNDSKDIYPCYVQQDKYDWVRIVSDGKEELYDKACQYPQKIISVNSEF